MRRRTLGNTLYKLEVIFSTGVASVTINGTKYTANTVLEFAPGTTVSWSATASTGYTITTASGTIVMNEDKTLNVVASAAKYILTLPMLKLYNTTKQLTVKITCEDGSTVDLDLNNKTITTTGNASSQGTPYSHSFAPDSTGHCDIIIDDGRKSVPGSGVTYSFQLPAGNATIQVSNGYIGEVVYEQCPNQDNFFDTYYYKTYFSQSSKTVKISKNNSFDLHVVSSDFFN